ncbi:MAG: hypothetical protein J5643_10570 [Lachnospiraceae bacterium]|nr:hypothetical protein [Lachnospiraceae bacterium]
MLNSLNFSKNGDLFAPFRSWVAETAAVEQGQDEVTGLYWCRARLEGTEAWSADTEAGPALEKTLRKLAAAIHCASLMPENGFPGLGCGSTREDALAAAWQDLFICAMRFKLKSVRLVAPDAGEEIPGFWEPYRERYLSAGMDVSVKDCGMLKRYPVLALQIDGQLVPGAGTTWKEAVLDCISRDIRRRLFGKPEGIPAYSDDDPSYPASSGFYRSTAEAIGEYLAMAKRYHTVIRAKDISVEGLSVMRVLLDEPNPGWNTESDYYTA